MVRTTLLFVALSAGSLLVSPGCSKSEEHTPGPELTPALKAAIEAHAGTCVPFMPDPRDTLVSFKCRRSSEAGAFASYLHEKETNRLRELELGVEASDVESAAPKLFAVLSTVTDSKVTDSVRQHLPEGHVAGGSDDPDAVFGNIKVWASSQEVWASKPARRYYTARVLWAPPPVE